MRFIKKKLVDMNRCYSVAHMTAHGKSRVFFATEGEGECVAFSEPDFAERETVWTGPGGCMSMVPIPFRPGDFLAGQRFFRMFQWEEAGLAWVEALKGGGWKMRELFALPYLHRFDVLTGADGAPHFIGCTLADHKESKEDWSVPGKVYASPLPQNPETWEETFAPVVIKDGLFQNHGYCRATIEGRECALVGAAQGIFALFPPEDVNGAWREKRLLDIPASDMAMADVDGDGEPEMAVIEGFHGDAFSVWKQRGDRWERLYEHPDRSDFYHVVWGGNLCGRQAFIGGCRRGSKALFALTWGNGAFVSREIEHGVGPSNVAVYNDADGGVIVSANREIAEGAVYFVRNTL